MRPPYDNGCIDTIGREEGHNIAFVPFPRAFETFAKVNGSSLHLRVVVRSVGFRILIDYYIVVRSALDRTLC